MPIHDEEFNLERRVFELEKTVSRLDITSAVIAAKVEGLVETIKSRFLAFDRGIELILERLKKIDNIEVVILEKQVPLENRLLNLERIRDKATGALILMRLLGITGIIGGIVAIVRMVRG